MPDQLQLRGGTTTEHNSFTGVAREVTVDTTKKTLVVHDGASAGGTALMKESGGNAASSVGIGTGGTNAINIDSSQKIGIGTASPQVLMHLNDTNARIQFTDSSTGSGSGDGVLVGLNGDDDFFINNRETSKNVLFFTQNTERMRIDSSGNVSIGSTSNSGGNRLNVVENSTDAFVNPSDSILRLTNENTSSDTNQTSISFSTSTTGASSDSAIVSLSSGSGNSNLLFFTDTANGMTEKMRIDSSGRLLLGTTTGASTDSGQGGTLTIANTNVGITLRSGTSNVGSIYFSDGTSGSDEVRGLVQYNHSTNFLRFFTDAAERMRIDSSGKVGIGTTSGGGKLAILSNSSTYEGLELQTPSGDGSGEFHIGVHQSGTSFGRTIVFKRGGADGMDTESMRIDGTGRLLIGTTTGTERLKVETTANTMVPMGINDSSNTSTTTHRILFATGGTEVGSIKSTNTGTTYNSGASDRSMKKNFESWNEDVLALFKNINPQKFNFIQEEDGASKSKGFVAQDMVSSFPEAYTKGEEDDAKYFFNPSGMVVYLMKAIQELSAKVEALEAA